MTDNTLIALIISTLLTGEAGVGIPNSPIAQAFQPTQQGVNTKPTAYLHKIGDKRYGFVKSGDVWDEDSQSMIHAEVQQYETTFQLSVLAIQNPAVPSQYTASDILNLMAAILQSSKTVVTLEAQGVGILRVMDVRNPYFRDDRGRNEASPSFDFVLTHKQRILSTSPVVAETELNIITV